MNVGPNFSKDAIFYFSFLSDFFYAQNIVSSRSFRYILSKMIKVMPG